jgi:anaphase-promoting complex subunit 2
VKDPLADLFRFELSIADHGSRTSRKADVISMLVNIYGSRKVFIQEYRKILADRILENFDFSLEREIRCKEFLKLRFGENFLHNCEVMLKDVTLSQKLNTDFEKDEQQKDDDAFAVSVLIRSVQFWPEPAKAQQPDEIALPSPVIQVSVVFSVTA